MISDGQFKGMKGSFVRTDGQITGINFTGHLTVTSGPVCGLA
jgi:hypothetical protein